LFAWILFALAVSDDVSVNQHHRVVIPVESGPDFYLERSSDMIVIGKKLYICENQAHRVQVLELGDPIRHLGTVADKGEGPGEVWLPFALAEGPDGGLVVRDNRGFSTFDSEDRFQDRFRVYTPHLDFVCTKDSLFYLTVRPNHTDLIDIYDWDGTVKGSLLEKFLKLEGNENDLLRFERYFYAGYLLSDEYHLYYINSVLGSIAKMDHTGVLDSERDIVEDLGPYGKAMQDKVEKYFDDPTALLAENGYIRYTQIQGSYLMGGDLYLLRWRDARPEYSSSTREILVYDSNDLSLKERVQFDIQPGEFVWAFAVYEDQGERHILLTMSTKDSDDFQLVELVQ